MPNRQIIKNIEKKIDSELSETYESKDDNNADQYQNYLQKISSFDTPLKSKRIIKSIDKSTTKPYVQRKGQQGVEQ